MNPLKHLSQRGLDNLVLISAATLGVNLTLVIGWLLFGGRRGFLITLVKHSGG